ncbi:MAG: hypothetical protein AAB482_03145 [Patescibacteria group bacterium]
MKLWALKRQAVGLSIFSVVVLSVVGYGLYSVLSKTSCTDGKQNGDEKGPDCGGSCPTTCLIEKPKPPRLLWSRVFTVADGLYDVGALVENINLYTGSSRAQYEFKLYDQNNVLLGKRTGTVLLFPRQKIFVYEPQLVTNTKRATRVEFTIDVPEWERIEGGDAIEMSVLKKSFTFDPYPIVHVSLLNQAIFVESNFEVDVLLERADGTVYAASRTNIEQMRDHEQKDLVFTWPQSIFDAPANIVVLYRRTSR